MSPRQLTPLLGSLLAWLPLIAVGQTAGSDTVQSPSTSSSAPSTQQARRPAEPIYGSQLMTPQERTEYRNKMRAAKTAEERERLRSEHHQEMLARAKERGVTLPEEAPARGRHGRGMGPGMGQGMGPGGGGGPGPRGGTAP